MYEGAVYMHQGKTFLCTKLDTAAKVALCTKADLKYYTKTRDFIDVHILGGELVGGSISHLSSLSRALKFQDLVRLVEN